MILDTGKRIDGRDTKTVRPIVAEVGILPATGGNAMAPDDAPFRITALAGALIYLFLEWADGNLGTDRAAFVDYCTQVIGQLLT